jgi:hypothetical protein
MRTDSLDWAALALGAAAADVSAVSPPELVAHLRQWADRFARAGCAGRKMSVLGRRLMAMGTAPRNSAICCRGYDGTPLSCGDGLQDRWSWPVRSATMGAVADDPALNRPIGWWLKKADGDLDAAFDRALLGSGRDVDRRRWQVLASPARRPTSRSAVVDALAAFDSASAVEGVVAELIQRGWIDEATGLLQLSPVGEREHAALAPLIDAVRL